MERWSIAVNGYFGTACVVRQTGPWWTFAGESTVSTLTRVAHRLIGWIPLPRWLLAVEVVDDGDVYTWGDYYGTHVGNLLGYIDPPVVAWAWQHRTTVWVETNFASVIKAFGKDAPAWWREAWDQGTESWRTFGPPDPATAPVYRTALDKPYDLV